MAEQTSNLLRAIRPGQLIPGFRLRSTDGSWVHSNDFADRRLILIFTGLNQWEETRHFLREVRAAYPRIAQEESVVLLVAPEEADIGRLTVPPVKVPFPVLRDVSSMVHRQFGAVNWSGQPALSVFITNHRRRVIYRCLSGLQQRLPSGREIVDFLEFDELAGKSQL